MAEEAGTNVRAQSHDPRQRKLRRLDALLRRQLVQLVDEPEVLVKVLSLKTRHRTLERPFRDIFRSLPFPTDEPPTERRVREYGDLSLGAVLHRRLDRGFERPEGELNLDDRDGGVLLSDENQGEAHRTNLLHGFDRLDADLARADVGKVSLVSEGDHGLHDVLGGLADRDARARNAVERLDAEDLACLFELFPPEVEAGVRPRFQRLGLECQPR